jgi:hypothetical protein
MKIRLSSFGGPHSHVCPACEETFPCPETWRDECTTWLKERSGPPDHFKFHPACARACMESFNTKAIIGGDLAILVQMFGTGALDHLARELRARTRGYREQYRRNMGYPPPPSLKFLALGARHEALDLYNAEVKKHVRWRTAARHAMNYEKKAAPRGFRLLPSENAVKTAAYRRLHPKAKPGRV